MRYRFLSHPWFQFSFIIWFVVGVLFIVGILGFSSWGTLIYIANHYPLTEYQQVLIRSNANQMISSLLVLAVVLAITFVVFGLYLSFKFVGPLSRLEVWLENYLKGGKQIPFKLRKRDELTKTAKLLFQVLEKQQRKNA